MLTYTLLIDFPSTFRASTGYLPDLEAAKLPSDARCVFDSSATAGCVISLNYECLPESLGGLRESGFPNRGAILKSDIEGQILPVPKRKNMKL